MITNTSTPNDTRLHPKDAFIFGSLVLQLFLVAFLFFRMESINDRVDDLTVQVAGQLKELRLDVRRNNTQMDNLLILVEKQSRQNDRVLELVQRPALNIRAGNGDVIELKNSTLTR